jgi:CRISPR/Cas system-associated exonuclease Cas4 (RecB family)
MTAWSYSSIKTFAQCPKKYYHLKVAKDVKDSGSAATLYGEDAHRAAENFIKSSHELPPKFAFMKPPLDALAAIPGTKLTENKLALAKTEGGYEPRAFFDKDVWWRGIADLIILNGPTAYAVDYKTGKNAKYADLTQLDLVAGAVFVHYPEVQVVRSSLLYVVSNEFIPKAHKREKMNTYLGTYDKELARLEGALESGVWNPVSGPLCGFCPVVSCAHNTKRQR